MSDLVDTDEEQEREDAALTLSGLNRPKSSRSEENANPFIATLPPKPERLSKENDLRGIISITKKCKPKVAIQKCEDANKRIQHLETLVKSIHHNATETHKVATAHFAEGKKQLTTLRRELKAATTERDRSKAERDKAKQSKDLLEVKYSSSLEMKQLREEEIKRIKVELKDFKAKVSTLEKEAKDLRKQLDNQSSAEVTKQSFQEKKAIELQAYRQKKQIDASLKEQADQRRKDAKEHRLKSITSGGSFGMFSDEDVSL